MRAFSVDLSVASQAQIRAVLNEMKHSGLTGGIYLWLVKIRIILRRLKLKFQLHLKGKKALDSTKGLQFAYMKFILPD